MIEFIKSCFTTPYLQLTAIQGFVVAIAYMVIFGIGYFIIGLIFWND